MRNRNRSSIDIHPAKYYYPIPPRPPRGISLSETYALVKALKQALHARGLTYQDVARHLDLSESSVKRLFSGRDFSLRRLESICQMMDLRLGDLIELSGKDRPLISQLSPEQEALLVSDIRLLLIAVCVTNRWTLDDVLQTYRISHSEAIRALAQLDRLKLIELQPGNRVRLLINQDFGWIKGGPIEQFFESQVQSDFFDSRFDAPGETRRFVSGMLSRHSAGVMLRLIEKLTREFRHLHDDDAHSALAERHGTSMMVALRGWELKAFERLRRSEPAPMPEPPDSPPQPRRWGA